MNAVRYCKSAFCVGLSAMTAVGIWVSLAHAKDLFSEEQARARAARIIRGDPYGSTLTAAAQTIKQARLFRQGETSSCGTMDGPAWEFHIAVMTANKDQFNNGLIDGYLVLDARTGEIKCTNLPLLD